MEQEKEREAGGAGGGQDIETKASIPLVLLVKAVSGHVDADKVNRSEKGGRTWKK